MDYRRARRAYIHRNAYPLARYEGEVDLSLLLTDEFCLFIYIIVFLKE